MALADSNYYEAVVYKNATVDASTRIDLPRGLGAFNQVTVRLVVGGVTGGSDTFDIDLDTSFTEGATTAGVRDWVEVISMTQASAATSETKYDVRDGSTSWGDVNSIEVTVGTGATATGVFLTVVGANA